MLACTTRSRAVGQELLAVLGADRARLHSIDTDRSCSSIPAHAVPADREEGRVADEIEQVIKPTIGTVGRPSVQLGLDLQYPQAGLIEARPRRDGVHRRLALRMVGNAASRALAAIAAMSATSASRARVQATVPATESAPHT